MKIFIFIVLATISNASLAIGWEEISKEDVAKRGISVHSEYNEFLECTKFRISLPKVLSFEYLGNRDFGSARYKAILVKKRGWQITSKGTEIYLPNSFVNDDVNIEGICLSGIDLKSAYLMVDYGGPQGSISMVVILSLGDYQ